jgi:hypothetical protein
MKAKGGEERGKDYNHSTFVDLVINGLLGEMCVLVVVVLCCVVLGVIVCLFMCEMVVCVCVCVCVVMVCV